MSEMNFDERIRSEMKDFHLEDVSPDWNEFKEKLDLAEIEADLSFDAEVAEHLQNFTAGNSAADWPVMEAKLEKANILRRRVIGMKLTELLIFLLLIATFFHVRPFDKNQIASQNNTFIAEQLTPAKEKNVSLNDQSNTNEQVVIAKPQGAEKISMSGSSDQKNNLNTPSEDRAPLGKNKTTQFSKVDNTIIPDEQFTELIIAEDDLFEESAVLAIDEPVFESLSTDVGIEAHNYVDDLASVVLLNTLEPSLEVSPLSLSLGAVKLSHVQHSEYKTWLNVYAGLDVDIVTTPYDPVYEIEAYTQSFTSNRLGASVSFYQNNFELETGVNYSEKNFQPGYVVKEISGRSSEEYTETSLQNIEFKMMQIPIHIKYHFANYKGWHLYGVGGSSLNIIAKANYDIKMKVLTGKPSPNPTPINEPKIHEKEFNSGLFTEGVLSTNSYFSLNGGLGIQRNISKKTALFVENTYQHHIFKGGVGPNMNRLNNFSFTTGVKTLIH